MVRFVRRGGAAICDVGVEAIKKRWGRGEEEEEEARICLVFHAPLVMSSTREEN